VKLALRLGGVAALLVGVALLASGFLIYLGMPASAEAQLSEEALDAIAIGGFGALLGSGLIVFAGRASRRDA
jgi:hypothetical protein